MALFDFHSHILPCLDDGAQTVGQSLSMLEMSVEQGVSNICATPHFYADCDDPATFLAERDRAYQALANAMEQRGGVYPNIHLGAEILYFPGMNHCQELKSMTIGRSKLLLIEPTMAPWSEYMLEEIEDVGKSLMCVPVIAHVDRYMHILRDDTMFDKLAGRKILVQVNAAFFTRKNTAHMALELLKNGRINFIGSDCHNTEDRAPDMGKAVSAIVGGGAEKNLKIINLIAKDMLFPLAI